MTYIVAKHPHPICGYRIETQNPTTRGKYFFLKIGMVDQRVKDSDGTVWAWKALVHDEYQDKFVRDLSEFVNKWIEENPQSE